MSKVYKNYKLTKEKIEEFPIVIISEDDEVFVGPPIGIVEYGRVYQKPVAVPSGAFTIIVEASELLVNLAKLKKFNFKVLDEGKLKEVDVKDADLSVRLPFDTNIEELVYRNGELIKYEKITEE